MLEQVQHDGGVQLISTPLDSACFSLKNTKMINVRETRIPARGVRSLVWSDDGLVDWVDGGCRYRLDGTIMRSCFRYAYPFDAATTSPSGEFSVIYTRRGTKGLVLRQGKIMREINRSYYLANAYEFPIALIRLKSGQEVMVHCPDAYNQLEIEDLATGERLTRPAERKARDCFHARLAGSPDGAFLVSAGWLWHPLDDVQVYDVTAALADPDHLDGNGLGIDAWAEDGASAAFLPDGRLAVNLIGVEMDSETMDIPILRIFDLAHPAAPQEVRCAERLGTMRAGKQDEASATIKMRIGGCRVVGGLRA